MPHDLTSHPPLQSIPPVQSIPIPKSTAQLACEAKGGKWDEATKTCTLPKKEEPSPVKPDDFFTDPKTGKVTGVTIGGKTRFISGSALDLFLKQQAEPPSREEQFRERVITERQQQFIEEERQRLIAEETPQRRELSPLLSFGEKIPILGGLIGVISDFVRPLKKKLGFKTFEQLPPFEERNFALAEIARKEREIGLTASESAGKLIESVGLSKLDVFGLSAKDLVETPSENAVEVLSNIRKEKRRITNIETNVKLGYLDVDVAQEQIRDIEENVIRLASRLGFLVSQSPELKFNSDFVNTMETEILGVEEKIFQAKLNILTGKLIDPTDIQILEQISSYEEEE